MKQFLQSRLYQIAGWLELVLAGIIAGVIAVLACLMVKNIFGDRGFLLGQDALTQFLESALGLVVGIEFVKMLVRHTPGNVIEVLLFALSRQIIVRHSDSLGTLLGIAGIAALFATRKFLFVNFDETRRSVYRASQKVNMVNHLCQVEIPHQEGNTLREVVVGELEKQKQTIGVGACVSFQGVALRIANITNGIVTRVEVIKEIT